MKKLLIAIILIVIVGVAYFMINHKEESNQIGEDIQKLALLTEEDFKKLEEQAITDVQNLEKVTEEDIVVAVDFLKTYVGKPVSELKKETAEKVVYYSTYLKELSKKFEVDVKHDFTLLAEKAYEYSKNVYIGLVNEEHQIATDISNEFKEISKKIEGIKDELVTNFTNLFNK